MSHEKEAQWEAARGGALHGSNLRCGAKSSALSQPLLSHTPVPGTCTPRYAQLRSYPLLQAKTLTLICVQKWNSNHCCLLSRDRLIARKTISNYHANSELPFSFQPLFLASMEIAFVHSNIWKRGFIYANRCISKKTNLHINECICASISEFEFFFAANTHPFRWL